MKRKLLAPALILLAACSPLKAEEGEEGELAPVPPPPVLPAGVEGDEALAPEVRIKEDNRGKVEEYRVGGRLYMVKITPAKGPAYYMVDSDGDGELDNREDSVDNISVPQWILFSWD